MGFKCKHVIIENCDFSPSTQLLERNVYITYSINQYVAHKTLRAINIKQGKTTNSNNSFFSEKKKELLRWVNLT